MLGTQTLLKPKKPSPNDLPRSFRPYEIAKLLGREEKLIWSLIRKGQLKGHPLGKGRDNYVITRGAFLDFLKRMQREKPWNAKY